MRCIRAVLCLLLLASCTPRSNNALLPTKTLQPYQSATPAPTVVLSDGQIVSPQAPLPSPTPFTYTIKPGDTMSQLAEKFNVPLEALLAANPGIDPNAMPIGKALQIPSNPRNPTGESTPTPAAFAVDQVGCYPTSDRAMWCFVLARNDTDDFMENLSAQITLLDSGGATVASQMATLPLNILPPHSALPLTAFFPPDVSSPVRPQVQILTAIRLLPGDQRYLPAVTRNTLVQVSWSGISAQVSGEVFLLPTSPSPAQRVWVAAVAYDRSGRVVGTRRWESRTDLQAGGSLPFSFAISSLGGKIGRVDFAVEAGR